MPAQINITSSDISYSESILFQERHHFDDERKEFIINLNTIDLQAVPGSGKTTVVLAKLLILEKHLPFDDGSGVLVISHTNAAVDEIKNRIARYCPKLFSYPSFVGTIQSFVDRFLAIPCYINKYKKKPYRIDNEIYDEKVKRYYNKLPQHGIKQWLDRKKDPETFLQRIRFDNYRNIISELNKSKDDFELKDNTKPTYKSLLKMKDDLLEWGYLHFDDAYFLANIYLQEFPQIKYLLQNRFQYIFVDEMQDMDKHQYNLLEDIFNTVGDNISSFQRIGDKNQAIFSGKIETEEIWNNAERKVLNLNGSHRLTDEIAKVVDCFAIKRSDGFEVRGLRTLKNKIKPHIIVFDDSNKVLPKFREIILEKDLKDDKYPFTAIGWTTHKTEEDKKSDKIRIQDYHEEFEKDEHRPKIDYQNLINYLVFYDSEKKTLESIRKNILNALLHILRLENILDDEGRNYTKSRLLSYLKEKDKERNEDKYEKLKLYIYQWSIGIIKGEIDTVFSGIKNYTPELLNFFKKEMDKCEEFIESSESVKKIATTPGHTYSRQKNKIEEDGIGIKIATVHSVKGKTHTATLYMETYYEGHEAYESMRLKKQFAGEIFNNSKKYHQQSTKMIYVGFSRPTHLLCFALHKDRFDESCFKDNWKIIDITSAASVS